MVVEDRSVVARKFFRVISIPEPLHHEIELTDGEQEKPVIVEYGHGQFGRARVVAHGIFHLAIGLRPPGIDRGMIDLRGLGFRLGFGGLLAFGLFIGLAPLRPLA
jgi:hypothetical protein